METGTIIFLVFLAIFLTLFMFSGGIHVTGAKLVSMLIYDCFLSLGRLVAQGGRKIYKAIVCVAKLLAKLYNRLTLGLRGQSRTRRRISDEEAPGRIFTRVGNIITRPGIIHERDPRRPSKARKLLQHLKLVKPLPSLPTPEACVVCAEDKDPSQFPRTRITAHCRHDPKTCLDCLNHWIKVELPKENAMPRIRCPEEPCTQVLDHKDVKMFATPDVFREYQKLAKRHAQLSAPHFHWCLAHPELGCQSGQIHNHFLFGPKMKCEQCGYETCVVHMVPWHKGESCRAYDIRNPDPDIRARDEILHIAGLKKLGFRDCPSCGVTVEKTQGCDHITCGTCRYEFCYLCGAQYAGRTGIRRVGNHAHEKTCFWYRPPAQT